MMRFACLFAFALLLVLTCVSASAGETWTGDQQAVLAAMERLSAATVPGGAGPDAYAAVLAGDFSRWTIGGGAMNGKQAWIDGMKSWFDDGWRVSDRDQEVLAITIMGEFAFTRRIVEETYLGPDGETSVSKAGLAETWIRGDGAWLLMRVDISVLDTP